LTASARGAVEAALPAGRWVERGAALALGLPAPIRRLLEPGAPL
jgi:A/G-specific adenine glycosylase